ncbi:MAG TPA: hypothetical protein PKM48_03630 [Parvularculaceae bacterium]|nr:hypothetical protein [Parvularculaceae bacterium]
MSRVSKAFALTCALLACSGCVLAAAAGAGYMAYDEATENDGKFDPLEKAQGKDDGRN